MPTSRKPKRDYFKALELPTLDDGSATEEAGRQLAGNLGEEWPAKKVSVETVRSDQTISRMSTTVFLLQVMAI